MENNQINKQEKPFDDKRAVVDKDISMMYPNIITTSNAIDELSNYVRKQFSDYAQKTFHKDDIKLDDNEEETPEEWIWVDGYKGTDSNMKCKDYQYELGKQHDMPEDAKIRDCQSGFHLCRELNDVFEYYGIYSNNRFFRVHALVRKKDFEEYGKGLDDSRYWYTPSRRNKLAAKSIVFVRELTTDEILKGSDAEKWTEEDKATVREHGIQYVKKAHNEATLVSLGYSKEFAKYIVDEGHFSAAYVAGTQKDLSVDMRVAYIMRSVY